MSSPLNVRRSASICRRNASKQRGRSGCDVPPLATKALAPARTRGLAGPWPLRVESKVYCPEGGTLQFRPILNKGRVIGTRVLLLRKDSEAPTIHALDGRHVIVDISLRSKGGGISFDPSYCDRSSIH